MDIPHGGARLCLPAAFFVLLAIGCPPAPAAVEECAFPPRVEGEPWDAFWAQHMTGADLMRREVEKSRTLIGGSLAGLVAVWDGSRGHGELVSQVVAGPRASAVVPVDRPASPKGTLWKGSLMSAFGLLREECARGGDCPAYVNRSMTWAGREFIAEVASGLAGLGVTMVVPAGNKRSPVERLKRRAALDGAALPVASLAPDGRPSGFTGYGDSVAIAAPADWALRTYGFDGEPEDFGGTSAAAPLVTGALVGYTILSGHRLAGPDEARLLLSRTALPIPRLPDGHLLGDGILNAHGMAAVARRVRERCGPDGGRGDLAGCASRLLKDPSTYLFEEEAAGLVERAGASGAFPECLPGGGEAARGPSPSCGRTAEAFDDLRRAALLAPSRPEAWEALACIRERRFSEDEGVHAVFRGPMIVSRLLGGDWSVRSGGHTDFHRAMARRARGKERDLVLDLCEGREDPRMAKYLPEASLARVVGRRECRFRPEVLWVAQASLFRGAKAWTPDPAMLFRDVFAR